MAVMIVDDASIMRMMLKEILVRFAKYNSDDIIEAVDGTDAIDKYKELESTPDFVICDIAMPDIDGIDVVKALIAHDPNAKIIMCSASTDEVDDCLAAGAVGYIKKPPKPQLVMAAIKEAKAMS